MVKEKREALTCVRRCRAIESLDFGGHIALGHP